LTIARRENRGAASGVATVVSDGPAATKAPPHWGKMSSETSTRVPNLRVAEIRIQDFRTIKDLWMPLRSSLVLLGENNAGKTSFLGALDIALGSARAREEDFRRDSTGTAADRFVIDVRFEPRTGDDFDDATAQVLGNGPVQLKGNEPPFFAIRSKGEVDPKRGELTLKRTFLKGWARDRVEGEKIAELASTQVSREHRYLVTFNLLDARRDAVEQLRNRRTFWGQIVADLRLSGEVRKEVESALATLGAKLKAGSAPLAALQTELQDIRQVIAHPKLDVEVAALPVDVEDLLRAMDLLLTEAGQTALPIAVQGMGTRSLSALLIFRAYVRSVLATAAGAGTLSVAAFEEPEAHLHPQAQRAVLSVIRQIPGERIISTHSPYVASAADVFDVRVFRRDADGTKTSWVSETDASGAPTFDNEQLAHLRRFVQLRHGEVLFARVVGLFEGDTEDAAFPVLARSHWSGGPDSLGISLINVGGAGNYKHIAKALTALSIPWVVFSDGDQAAKNGLAAAGKAIGCTLDATCADVVMLPNGHDFEAYLLAEGFRSVAEKAIDSFFGTTALADYKQKNHGQTAKGGGTRDYVSADWEGRLVHDFMDRHKGTYGAALAEHIVAAGKLPTRVKDYFQRIDAILGRQVTP
jgi:putative ATP-dependent endonuclease of the OLD family